MSNVIAFPDREKSMEQAALWLTLMDERALNKDEREEFREWIQASDQHVQAYKEIASLWGRMDQLSALAEIFPLEESATTVAGSAIPVRWRSGLAAAFVLVAFAAALLGTQQILFPESGEVYVTEVGQTQVINLNDGSVVTANTDTQLSVSLTSLDRRIVLEKGEAYFEVAHDAGRPFFVDVGEATIRAVGTAFSVHRKNGSFEVVVTEGTVELSYMNQQHVDSSAAELSQTSSQTLNATLLEVGQYAEYLESDTGNAFPVTRVANLEQSELLRKLSWRQGMLAFEGDPLEKVIEEFSRYTNMEIEITSDELRGLRVGGYFSSRDLEGMLTSLSNNFGVQVTRTGDKYISLSASLQ